MQQNSIEVSGLTKSFRGVDVLKGIDLAIPQGSIFCLIGSNGAGKTTTINILTTLLPPDGGKIYMCGFDLRKSPHKVREIIRVTGQYAAVDALLTGRENMHLMGRLLHVPEYTLRAQALLRQFDLEDAADRRSGTYSGGMRRKLDIAMSLMGNPKILFLDEPTTGLDPKTRITMWQEIEKLKKSGMTIFLTTQYLEEAERLADYIAMLSQGRIVAEGTVAQLIDLLPRGAIRFVFEAGQYAAAQNLLAPNAAMAMDEEDQSLTVMTDGSVQTLADILSTLTQAGICPKRVVQQEPTLEDVFVAKLNTTGGGKS